MRLSVLLVLAGCIFPPLSPAQDRYQYPFQNPNLPIEQCIDNLLSLMTLQENFDALGTNPDVPRLGVHGSGKIVSDGVRKVKSTVTIAQPGYHTLKFQMVDPGVVLEKLIASHGEVPSSYLGPPESYHNLGSVESSRP